MAGDRRACATHGGGGQDAGASAADLSGLGRATPSGGWHPEIATQVRRVSDAEGLARDDDWAPGADGRSAGAGDPCAARSIRRSRRIIGRAQAGDRWTQPEIVRLFAARDADYRRVIAAADELRRAVSGDTVRYVVNRNINYTNICYYRCKFCAFSKGRTHEALRGAPYDLALEEIVRRAAEAWERGATEVCLQGGIHPDYTGETYLAHLPRDQGGGAGDAYPCLLAAGGHAGRGDARAVASGDSWPS